MATLLGVQSELQTVVQQHVDAGCKVLGVCDETELYWQDQSVLLKRVHLERPDGSCFDLFEGEGGTNQWPNGFYVLTNLHREEV